MYECAYMCVYTYNVRLIRSSVKKIPHRASTSPKRVNPNTEVLPGEGIPSSPITYSRPSSSSSGSPSEDPLPSFHPSWPLCQASLTLLNDAIRLPPPGRHHCGTAGQGTACNGPLWHSLQWWCLVGVLVPMPPVPLLSQLPAECTKGAMEDRPCAWASAAHVRELHGAPGSHLQPGPALDMVTIWGSKGIKRRSVSLLSLSFCRSSF